MNAHLPLLAGVLAVLALGVVGAVPGGAISTAAPSHPSLCPIQAALNAPAWMTSGVTFPVSAHVVEHGSCALTIAGFVFTGLPSASGPVASSSGLVMTSASYSGAYSIEVVIQTSLGTVSTSTTVNVQ